MSRRLAILAIATLGLGAAGCGDDSTDEAQRQANDAIDRAQERAGELQRQADEAIEDARTQEQLDEVQRQIDQAAEEAQQRAQQAQEELESLQDVDPELRKRLQEALDAAAGGS